MSAPAVHYATTEDGYTIAYTASGQGHPLIFLPSWINHVQDVWRDHFSVAYLLNDLSDRYRVFNYDSRGMGLSTRELGGGLTLDSYMADLEAVVQRAGVERFVLLGFSTFAFLAVLYALRYPERVEALVLINVPYPYQPAAQEELARQNWEAFLWSNTSRRYSLEQAQDVLQMFMRWSTPENYFASVPVWRDARVEAGVRALGAASLEDAAGLPVLVLASRGLRSYEQQAGDFARLVPGSRLVFLESGLPFGGPGEAAGPIEAFLADAGIEPGPAPHGAGLDGAAAGLSEREIEVLSLLAAGKSNAQIAKELMISRNTVIRHVSNIFAKTEASNRTEAASFAHRHGLTRATR